MFGHNEWRRGKERHGRMTRRDFGAATAGMIAAGTSALGRAVNCLAEPSEAARQVWWLGADPHVAYRARRARRGYDAQLEQCAEDVNRLGMADYAAVLGDLGGKDLLCGADRIQTGENVSRFRDAMSSFKVAEWHYVTGNHEFIDDRIVIRPRYWAQDALGIRLLFISDERPGYAAGMGSEQEAWFFKELEEHAHRPVFVFSHQPPDRSGPWNMWGRLRKRLGEFSIRMWFHGHEHHWAIDEPTDYGFTRVGLAAIYEYTGHARFVDAGIGHHNGALLTLTRSGTHTEVSVRFRDHKKREWIAADGCQEVSCSFEV